MCISHSAETLCAASVVAALSLNQCNSLLQKVDIWLKNLCKDPSSSVQGDPNWECCYTSIYFLSCILCVFIFLVVTDCALHMLRFSGYMPGTNHIQLQNRASSMQSSSAASAEATAVGLSWFSACHWPHGKLQNYLYDFVSEYWNQSAGSSCYTTIFHLPKFYLTFRSYP